MTMISGIVFDILTPLSLSVNLVDDPGGIVSGLRPTEGCKLRGFRIYEVYKYCLGTQGLRTFFTLK